MRSTPLVAVIGLLCAALLGTACSATAPAAGSAGPSGLAASGSTAEPTSAAPTSAASSAPSPTLQSTSPDSWLAVGTKGSPGIQVIRASTGEQMLDLSTGVPTDNQWGRMVTATVAGSRTMVRDLIVQPGLSGAFVSLDGAWKLPTIGLDPVPVGVALGGATIVLTEVARSASSASTRFAVVDGSFAKPARIIALPGRFDYDALSPDGRTLYLVEHLDVAAGGAYQVRDVDVASGTLKPGVVADKSELTEQMAGYPLAQVRRDDGFVLTLYRGREHPFIHTLNSIDAWAFCLDLPATGADDAAAAADWGLAPSPDGQSVYAANSTLGLVVQVDPAKLAIVRSVTVKPLASREMILAKFGHEESGPTGRRVIVSPDGRTIFAAGAGGILAIDASTLRVVATFQPGESIDALGLSTDGRTLYALLHAGGHIVELDARTGQPLATVPGDGYDRLVAVVPW